MQPTGFKAAAPLNICREAQLDAQPSDSPCTACQVRRLSHRPRARELSVLQQLPHNSSHIGCNTHVNNAATCCSTIWHTTLLAVTTSSTCLSVHLPACPPASLSVHVSLCLCSGSWRSEEFKDYNFNAFGAPVTGGNLHPLMKVTNTHSLTQTHPSHILTSHI